MGSEIGKKKEIIYLNLTITLAVFRYICSDDIEKRDCLLLDYEGSLFLLWDSQANRTYGRAGKSPAAWERDARVSTP